MIKVKKKKCKGNGKAKDFKGCGKSTYLFRYGLCRACFYEFNKTQTKPFRKLKVPKYVNKKSSKNKSYYTNKLQNLINTIVRLIDNGKACHSCTHGENGNFTRQKHAGHLHSIGSQVQLRFNFFNIYLQCNVCNVHKSGNGPAFWHKLSSLYSSDYIVKLRELKQAKPLNLSISDLKEKILICRETIADLQAGKMFTRSELNTKLGIYYNE